jgi:SP family myo-inositol transporter-like MFS transporter 13
MGDNLGAYSSRNSIARASFDRAHQQMPTGRRGSFTRASFDKANAAMVFPDATHVEVTDEDVDGIEAVGGGVFVWLVAFCASVAGMLFGYDTGIISAVLVYLDTDLGKVLTPNEKELITSLCSGGAFVGAIIAGLTADRYGGKGAIYAGYAWLFRIYPNSHS